ncbi:MAG: hypothetical protein AAF206_20645, partial [Bacteroidota bacterium]
MPQAHFSEEELLDQIRKRGFEARAAIHFLYRELWQYCRKLQSQYELSDVDYRTAMTDGILSCVESIRDGRFRGEASLKAFAYKIIRYKCVDTLKKHQTKEIYTESSPSSFAMEESSAPHPYDEIQSTILREAMAM